MDIKAAFLKLLDSDEWVKKAGMSDISRRQFRHRLSTEDQTLRPDTMRAWLTKAGFKESSFWQFPK